MAAVSGGRNAVEQVDSSRYSLQQIGWKPHSHKITGDLLRQVRLQALENAVHYRLRLTHGEASDGDAGPGTSLEGTFERAEPQLAVDAGVDNGPERLRGSGAAGQRGSLGSAQ